MDRLLTSTASSTAPVQATRQLRDNDCIAASKGYVGCVEILIYVGVFAAFIVIYVAIRRRSAKPGKKRPPVQWGWLTAIVACALAAILIGALLEL
jgi:NADH:ubiquinone oxidoreductase subunit 6 (subunit J)